MGLRFGGRTGPGSGYRILKLAIIAHGKAGRGPEAELVGRYLKRIPWQASVTELSEGAPFPPPSAGSRTVVLDERGRNLSSEELADVVGRWRNDGIREVRFLIGAADGHSDEARADADLLLGFGRATWPHLLARAMLAEQLYRTVTILSGHPYHRG